ncbi:MAG: dUTP diphosphatase [Thermodesulfobacteriota bacterium]
MDSVTVEFCWLNPSEVQDLKALFYQTEHASGMDVQVAVESEETLAPGEIKLLATGFAVAIPPGYEIQVRPRSGLAVKHGITVVNSPGTIDADYRGEVRVGLINLGRKPFVIKRGDRIAQLVLAPVCQADFKKVTVLAETQRGDGGFGHTGV